MEQNKKDGKTDIRITNCPSENYPKCHENDKYSYSKTKRAPVLEKTSAHSTKNGRPFFCYILKRIMLVEVNLLSVLPHETDRICLDGLQELHDSITILLGKMVEIQDT